MGAVVNKCDRLAVTIETRPVEGRGFYPSRVTVETPIGLDHCENWQDAGRVVGRALAGLAGATGDGFSLLPMLAVAAVHTGISPGHEPADEAALDDFVKAARRLVKQWAS